MNKQIEEMAKDIRIAETEYMVAMLTADIDSMIDGTAGEDERIATALYEMGYRKASDVIDDVNRSLTTKVFNSNEIATGYLWAITDVRKLLLKLKKKYESEGAE